MSEHIGIVCSDLGELSKRTYQSPITEIVNPLYEAGAIIPDPRHLAAVSPDDLEPYRATQDTPASGCIEIISFTAGLKSYIEANRDKALAPTYCRPHQITTTQNTCNNNLLTGLHVDSKQNLPLQERTTSHRRIGLNMGPGHRFLLVGTVDIFDIAAATEATPDEALNTGHVRAYAKESGQHQQPLRCLWLLLRPGEGYIAPTENIIHDGSTWRAREPSTIHFWIDDWDRGVYDSAV